jgi:hypothetical protein
LLIKRKTNTTCHIKAQTTTWVVLKDKLQWRVIQEWRYEVGDGYQVLFWHDVWYGEQTLKDLFPELFLIACAKDEWVAETMQAHNGSIHWNGLFTRPVHDWEVDLVSRFFELLYSQRVRHGGEDKIC